MAPMTDTIGADQAAPRTSTRRGRVTELATTVILAVLLYWVLQAFVVGTYRVEGMSMEATLQDGQHLLVDKLTPRLFPYRDGDIVVLHPPASEHSDIPFIKRIIGVAGDHIEIRDGSVWRNGAPLDETYLAPGSVTRPTGGQSAWDVDRGDVLVMGDNRLHSEDGRVFGEIPVDQIIGRAWLRFWPLDSLGMVGAP